MAGAFKPNRAGLRALERGIQREFDKFNLTVPVRATGPTTSLPALPPDEDLVLKALYEMGAHYSDVGADKIAQHLGLEEQDVRRILQSTRLIDFIDSDGYAAGGRLSDKGRQYVADQNLPPVAPAGSTMVNHFNGPTQYSVGDHNSQVMSANGHDAADVLHELVGAVREVGWGHLTGEQQSDLQADLQILEAQAQTTTEVPGYRRALRTVRGFADKVTVSAGAKLIVENADKLLAALP